MVSESLYVLLFLTAFLRSAISEVNVPVGDDVTVSKIETVAQKQTFKEAEKEITDFVNSLLRSILPKVVGGSGSASLTPKCTAGLMKLFGNVRRLKGWTIKMLDSMGKPSAGIFKGTSYSLGNYDECLDLSVTNKGEETTDRSEAMFRGMYCRARIQFPEAVIVTARDYFKGEVNASDLGKLKDIIQTIPYFPGMSDYMSHFLGLCLPSTCSLTDANELVKLLPFPGTSTIDKCEVRTSAEVDSPQLIIICIFLLLFSLACVSTFIDWVLHIRKSEEKTYDIQDKRCVSVTIAFSFCNNTKRLMKNIECDEARSLPGHCVRGIMVASVCWVIMGHTYLFPNDAFYKQSSYLENLRTYWDQGCFSFVINFPLAIDALFVCYGFLFTYKLWYSASKTQDVNVNVISLIFNYYLRFCLPLLLCLGVTILLPLLGSGPFWSDFLDDTVERCKTNSWAYIGMYSNFLDLHEQCFPHLWFVACLSQLTLLSIFLSWIISKNMKLGISFAVLITVICNITVGMITYREGFPPSYVAYFAENNSSSFWRYNFALPLSHFGPYAAGMLTGILIARRVHHKMRACLGVILWIACIAMLCGVLLLAYKFRDGSFSPTFSALYAGNHRTVFGVCVAWVMIACSFGSAGFVNSILSWRVFDPLYKLSYYAYLFHFLIIAYIVSVSKERFYYSHLDLVLRTGSYIMATYFVVYFLFMFLDMPLKSLSSAFCSSRFRQAEVTPLNGAMSHKINLLPQSSVQGSCKLWSITETHNGVSY